MLGLSHLNKWESFLNIVPYDGFPCTAYLSNRTMVKWRADYYLICVSKCIALKNKEIQSKYLLLNSERSVKIRYIWNIFYFSMYNLKFSLQMHSLLNWGLRWKKLGLCIYFLEDKNSLNIKPTILQINNQIQMSFISSFSPMQLISDPWILGQASAFMQVSASGLDLLRVNLITAGETEWLIFCHNRQYCDGKE